MRLAVTLALLGVLLAAACGDSTPPEPTATPAPTATPVPDSLVIPSLGVDTPVRPKRFVLGRPLPDPDGPDDIALYDFGPRLPDLGGAPGRGGNVVLFGRSISEVCDTGEPPCDGALLRLEEIELGAVVELAWLGETHAYQAVALCSLPIAGFSDMLYQRTIEEQLTLLTGAGSWDASKGFSHVLIVVAKPAPVTVIEPCPAGSVPGKP